MLGPRSAGELPRGPWACLRPLTVATRCACRSAIEDRLAALDSRSGCGRGWGGRNNSCLVDRPRACLRHNHPAGRRRRGCCRRAVLGGRCRSRGRLRRWSFHRGSSALRNRSRSRSFRHRSGRRQSRRLQGSSRCHRRVRGCRHSGSLRSSGRGTGGSRRLGGNNRPLGSARLLLARRHCDGRLNNYRAGRWRNDDHRSRGRCGAGRRLGYHCPCWGTRGDRRRSGRSCHNGRSRPRLRHNPARFRTGRCSNGRSRGWRSGSCNRSGRRCNNRLDRRRHRARSIFLFPFLGQNGLHHIAGLGDVREINLGRNRLLATRTGSARERRRPLAARHMRAHLLRFVRLKRARVGFAGAQAELRQYVKNLSAFDFHLAREIVDSNLAHPPLFKTCCPPLSCS